jgi:hypothetical protein
MSVTLQENEQYRQFVSEVAQRLGVFDFKPDQIVWHYTDGPGLLGILQSSTIYATQVASLNDANETKYATDLFKEAVRQLMKERAADAHPSFTKISVQLLLEQMGYSNVPVEVTKCSLTRV